QPPRRVRLDPEVQRRHPEPGLARRGHDVRLRRRHLTREVGTGHRRVRGHGLDHLVRSGQAVAGEHARAHGAVLADVAGERPGVHIGDTDDPLRLQLVVETARRTPARRAARGIAHHVTGDPDALRLVVLVVPPGVADLRRRLHHDLPAVGRVGQRLLIARHARAEHDLAERGTLSTVGGAPENAAVLEHECGRCTCAGHTWAPPLTLSIHSGYTPRSSARKPVSTSTASSASPARRVTRTGLSVPMTLPAMPLPVATAVIAARGIQSPGMPARSTSIPSACRRNVAGPRSPAPRVTMRSCQCPAYVVATYSPVVSSCGAPGS